jgi:glutamate decarboxylase
MLAELWHVPDRSRPQGTSTLGSTEGILLGGLALLRRWRQRRQAERGDSSPAGPPEEVTAKPNLVMGRWAPVATPGTAAPR